MTEQITIESLKEEIELLKKSLKVTSKVKREYNTGKKRQLLEDLTLSQVALEEAKEAIKRNQAILDELKPKQTALLKESARLGITQTAMAEALGISKAAVYSRFETIRHNRKKK